MGNTNKYIAFFLSALFTAGITLSVVLHVHEVHQNKSQTEHQWVVDHQFCAICGSVFKYTPSNHTVFEKEEHADRFLFSPQTRIAATSFSNAPDGRAPPFFGS